VSEFPSYRHVESRCPQCNYKIDAATKVHGEEAAPECGDNSVCINCGQVLTYQADLTLRKATAQEISELMDNSEAWATIEKAQVLIRERAKVDGYDRSK
jgi:hypothetical protein